MVYSPQGTNHTIQLLFGTSVYDLKQSAMPSASDLAEQGGLKLFSPASARVKIREPFFSRNPIESLTLLRFRPLHASCGLELPNSVEEGGKRWAPGSISTKGLIRKAFFQAILVNTMNRPDDDKWLYWLPFAVQDFSSVDYP